MSQTEYATRGDALASQFARQGKRIYDVDQKPIEAHIECGLWHQQGPLTVCDCGKRLYRGLAPRDDQERLAVCRRLRRLRDSVEVEAQLNKRIGWAAKEIE